MCRSRASGWRATCRRPSGRRSNIWTRAARRFARYLRVRANRKDDFYIRPAGGVDLCNVQVPVRKKGLSLGRPGVGRVAVLVLDDHRAVVRAHARFGQRQRGRAEGAFGRHPADDPVGPPAAGAMVDLMLAVDGVIAPLVGLAQFRSEPGRSACDLPFAPRQRATGRAVARQLARIGLREGGR